MQIETQAKRGNLLFVKLSVHGMMCTRAPENTHEKAPANAWTPMLTTFGAYRGHAKSRLYVELKTLRLDWVVGGRKNA